MYRRNSDESLRRLERAAQYDPQAYSQWMLALYRAGREKELLALIDDKIQDDVILLNQHLIQDNYQCLDPEMFSRGPILSPEPPPPDRFLTMISNPNTDYYISEVGSFGTTWSELAMHVGLTGNDIERYLLLSTNPPRVSYAAVEFHNSTKNRNTITDGLPSEVLSTEIRREIGYEDPEIPRDSSHYPLVPYKATIVGTGDGIYRASISLFYYPHQTYWRLTTDDWTYRSMSHLIENVWPTYKEIIN